MINIDIPLVPAYLHTELKNYIKAKKD